jgi:cardiolipin synthase
MLRNGKAARYLTHGLAAFGAGAFVLHAWRLALTVGGAPTRYRVDRHRLPPIDSEEFCDYLSTMIDAQVHPHTRVSFLRNGRQFYPAEVQAIQSAKASINLEAYEFSEGDVTKQVLQALSDRARAGVEVRMVVDAIGSWATRSSYFDALRAAGGRLAWYHPVNSKSWPYLNNRTHRKLLVVDGKVGFIGGADFADHWLKATKEGPPWRDTVLRLEGSAVAGLNATFAENWLEMTGEILGESGQFQFDRLESGVPAMIVSSTPRGGDHTLQNALPNSY